MLPKLPLNLIDSRGKNYSVRLARSSGGKAGKGNNKTSTIQVWYEGYLVVKQIRYNVGDKESEGIAIKKAVSYSVGPREAEKYFSD